MSNSLENYWPKEIGFYPGDTVRCGYYFGIIMYGTYSHNYFLNIYKDVYILFEKEHLVYEKITVPQYIKLESKRILLIECVNFGLGKEIFK